MQFRSKMNTSLVLCIYVFSLISLSSCATLTHKDSMAMLVNTNLHNVQLTVNNDTAHIYNLPKTIEVKRSSQPIILTVFNDSIKKSTYVSSNLSKDFWWGNILNCTSTIGWLVDLTNSRRFEYPDYILLDTTNGRLYNSITKIKPSFSKKKGQVDVSIGTQVGNSFYLNTGGTQYKSRFGFLGLSAGVEYYIANNNSIYASFGAIMDHLIPVPVGIDGEHERASAIFTTIQWKKSYDRLQGGIGLQFHRTFFWKEDWIENDEYTGEYVSHTTKQSSLGPAFSFQYACSPLFHIGLDYQPSLLAINSGKWSTQYDHLLFFSLIWKFKVTK